MTWTDLKEFVGAADTDDAFVSSCWSQASALVTQYNRVGVYDADLNSWTYVASAAPAAVVDRAILEVGSELFHRRNAPNGIAQFASYDGGPVRVARDPMVAAYAILNPYLVVGF